MFILFCVLVTSMSGSGVLDLVSSITMLGGWLGRMSVFMLSVTLGLSSVDQQIRQ